MQHPSTTTIPSADFDILTNATPDAGGHHRYGRDVAHTLSRRALLGNLPAAAAALALPFPDFGTTTFPAFGNGDGEPPHPILALPFVRQSTEAERKMGAPPRRFWSISPCGVHGTDCGTGSRYAEAALDYMIREQTPYVFQWAVLDMIRQGRPHSGIEIGFLSAFGRLASEAWGARMTIKTGNLA